MMFTDTRERISRVSVNTPALRAWQTGGRFALRYFRSRELGFLAAGADSEYLGSTRGARARCRRLAVLHGDSLGVRDLALASTLDAIGFHHNPPSLWVHILYRLDARLSRCSINLFFNTKCGMQLHQVCSAVGPPSLWRPSPNVVRPDRNAWNRSRSWSGTDASLLC